MNHHQAIALRNELTATGEYTLVYVDRCSQHGLSGFETIALKTEPRFDAQIGKVVQKIVDEVHHINYDRTGALVI